MAGTVGTTDPSGLTFSQYQADKTGKYYIYEYTSKEAGKVDSFDSHAVSALSTQQGGAEATDPGTDYHIKYEANAKIARIFQEYTVDTTDYVFDGTFESVNTEEGYLLKGLNTGNYILQEQDAPIGYNELPEHI